ncbi:MAG: hypothetical protein ACXADH_07670 [Candidatus Kariarchaeaceae archaeon]|jgi:hypothetical protein
MATNEIRKLHKYFVIVDKYGNPSDIHENGRDNVTTTMQAIVYADTEEELKAIAYKSYTKESEDAEAVFTKKSFTDLRTLSTDNYMDLQVKEAGFIDKTINVIKNLF